MTTTTALVVAGSETAQDELGWALRENGVDVVHITPTELLSGPSPQVPYDVLFISASLGLKGVEEVTERLSEAGLAPAVVVFPEGDLTELEACVDGGFDYITPPFLPVLLRSRMALSRGREQLSNQVVELAAAATLREYESDMKIAREIQAGFLPERLPTPHGWDFAARFRPARQVAGDFYDGFELVNGLRLGFVVADVCDKGVGAALFMALIRTLLRHTAEHTGAYDLMDAETGIPFDPAAELGDELPPLLSIGAGPLLQAVVGTNRYLTKNHLRQGYFATLFFGVLDPLSGSVVYINGGHNPPVLIRAGGQEELLPPTGPAVGMMAGSIFSLGHTKLDPGDSLFVYTDGVVEARGPDGELFGTDRMLAMLRQRTDSIEELLHSVDVTLEQFVRTAEQSDDITMLALRRAVG